VTPRCIALLGGSFDPVHNGHVALATLFVRLLLPDALHILPAGNPWQKNGLHASAQDRLEMVRRAFTGQPVPVIVDEQEIRRAAPTYTIDTLRAVRTALGPGTSIVFLLGADQLQHFDTWREWQSLFDYANFAVASRPGYTIDALQLPSPVAREFKRRAGTPEQVRDTPHGLTYLASNLAVDVSATEIRSLLQRGDAPASLRPLIPAGVLDYIQQHNLYKS
jgi:nicotinate-nucleotide adenylyltransferase